MPCTKHDFDGTAIAGDDKPLGISIGRTNRLHWNRGYERELRVVVHPSAPIKTDAFTYGCIHPDSRFVKKHNVGVNHGLACASTVA
jgi:hypothetical protein